MFKAAARMVKSFGYLGERGWELVGMYDKSSNWIGSVEKGFALFKRIVAEGDQPDGPWAKSDEATGIDDGHKDDPNWGAW